MPAKSYLFFFLGVTLLSTSLHYFVFTQLRRTLKKDFGARAARLIRLAAIVFITMEFPFVLLFLRKHLTADPVIYTKFLFYPFTVWQAIMLMWAVILTPQVLYRKIRARWGDQKFASGTRAAGALKTPSDGYQWNVTTPKTTSKV